MTILNPRRHGIAALIWFSFGLILTLLMRRLLLDNSVEGLFIWLLLGWLGPVLLLAVSGVRKGSSVDRVCAALALVAFVVLIGLASRSFGGLGGVVVFALMFFLLTLVSGGFSFIALVAALLPRAHPRWSYFYYITALSVLQAVMVPLMNPDFSGGLKLCLPLFMSLAALCVYYIKTLPKQAIDSYGGPRCVACAAPMAHGVSLCPKCGWTQPP